GDLLLGDPEGLQRDGHPAVEAHLHQDLLDLGRRDPDVKRALEVPAKVVIPAEHGERRDGQHAPRLEIEPGPRVHAPEHDLVAEPQEIVGKTAVSDGALLARAEKPALHVESLPVRVLAHLVLPAPRGARVGCRIESRPSPWHRPPARPWSQSRAGGLTGLTSSTAPPAS